MKKLIAHRGLKLNNIKENTLDAFQAALQHPAYVGFECDIRTSLDGVFVVVHNPMVKDDIISLSTAEKLKKEHGIPTLEEVLQLKENKVFLLEIKEANLNVGKFLAEISKHQEKNIYLMSFHNSVIKKLAKKDRFYKIGVLNYVLNSEENYEIYDFICLLESIVTPKLVEYFKEKKIEVFLYGIHHYKKTAENYPDCYFITDIVETIKETCKLKYDEI